MLRDVPDLGGGGGGGGGSGSFTQTPDNLRSEDLFEGLLGLGHGRWKGLTNGLSSLRINDTPLVDQAGKSNFVGWVATYADGDPTQFPQKPSLTLGTGASPVNINVPLANTAGTGTPVVRTVSNVGADFIDLRFIISELFHQDKTGVFNNTMHIAVRMKPTGHTTWIEVLVDNTGTEPTYTTSGVALGSGMTRLYSPSYYNPSTGYRDNTGIVSGQLTVTGKTTQVYVKEVRIAVPNTGSYASTGWDIECTLTDIASYSADPVTDKRTVTWESASAVYKDTTLGTAADWVGLSWLQITGQATDQINGQPTIWGEYDTKIISVPPSSIYDPTTRQYTGSVWDGSWVKAYTNDPAWVINDILTDPIAGVSAIAPGSYLNKWDALEMSQYCSTLVSDGASGTHPRFSINGNWSDPQRADEFVRNIAGAVGAVAWDNGGGEWRCRIDKLENPVAIFTEENIEGEFNYSHTDVDTRYNDITIKFNNAEFEHRPDSVRVFDQTNINNSGRKPITIPALGCTSRQEALRRGTLRLRASLNEYRMVSFVTNRQARFLEPLSTILVADKSLGYTAPTGSTALANTDARDETTGRILSLDGTRTVITLRDPLRLEPGATYNIRLTVPNANYNPDSTTAPTGTDWDKPTIVISQAVATGSPRGDVTSITLTAALPANTPPNANFALEATGLPANPKTYRIISLEQDDDENHERIRVTAIEVDTGKYAAADSATATSYSFELPPATPPTPLNPTGGMLNLRTFASAYTFQRVLEVDWARPSSKFIQGYIVKYQLNDGPMMTLPMTTQLRVEIPDPQFGVYKVYVATVDTSDKLSKPLFATITVNEQSLIGAIGYLTNEAHTIPADSTGAVTSYSGATGQFKVLIGTTDVTAGCTFAITSNAAALTGPYGTGVPLDTATGTYNVTGGLDAGEANASLTIRATHTASGYTVDKTFTLAKAITGATGTTKIISLATTHFTFQYNLTTPITQTTTLTATRTNPGSGTTLWNVYKADGTAILTGQTGAQLATAGYCTSSSNDVLTITETQFDAKLTANSTTGLIFRAYYSDLTGTFDQVTLVKVTNGANGINAETLYITSDRQQITYNAAGSPSPATQTTTCTIYPQNLSSGTYTLSMTKADGTVINANTYLTAINGSFAASGNNITWTGSGTQFSMTAANFDTARGTTQGVIITISHADGVSDKLSIIRTSDGPGGPVIALSADALSFNFADGVAVDSNQLITVTASLQNTSETINWSVSPSVTLGAPDGTHRTLSLANFGTQQQVVITATGATSGATASITLIRNDVQTLGDSILTDSDFTFAKAGFGPTFTWNRTGGFTRVQTP